jgi:hypothetical protein
MLKATWRRLGSSAWLSIGLLILVPALAEAQLFPNRTIRRERPSPATENPFNAKIRSDYYGYFPTCWTRFPEGWDCPCPNPEKPNRAASEAKIPFTPNRIPEETGQGPDDRTGDNPNAPGMNPNPGDNPDIPPLPAPGRSIFDIPDQRPPATRPVTPDPFTTPDPSAPKPPPPGGRPSSPPPGNGAGASTGLMEMPSLPATSPTASIESNLEPGSIAMVPEATLASSAGSARPDLGPLPSATTPSPFAPSNGSTVVDSEPIANMPTQAPAQAPKRRSLISRLFGSGNTRNR